MNNQDFNKQFNSINKTVDRTIVAVILIWLVGTIGSLATVAALVYVSYHFISKFW